MNNIEKAIRIALGIKHHLINDDDTPDDETAKYVEELTAYTILAHCAGLVKDHDDIYKDDRGVKYIQTKFGFQPVLQFEKDLQIRQLTEQVKEFENMVDDKDAELIKLKEEKVAWQTKAHERRHQLEELATQFKALIADNQQLKDLLTRNEKLRTALLLDKKIMQGTNNNLIQKLNVQKQKSEIDLQEIKNIFNQNPQSILHELLTDYNKTFDSILDSIKAVIKTPDLSHTGKMTRINHYLTRLEELCKKLIL